MAKCGYGDVMKRVEEAWKAVYEAFKDLAAYIKK
jgi:hypothetical protein